VAAPAGSFFILNSAFCLHTYSVAQALLISTLVTIAGLIATIVMGFRATPAHVAEHIITAIVTVVVGLFSQSMTMFFFIGSGKELKEKSGQDPAVVGQTRAFKNSVFPAAMWAMAAIMVTFITGGGVGSGRTPLWVHDALAAISIVMYARAYWIQIRTMNENANLMERYLRD
jgi:small-conductance mechanosensitive channel